VSFTEDDRTFLARERPSGVTVARVRGFGHAWWAEKSSSRCFDRETHSELAI
jgi:hypothetical protein